MKAPTAVLLMGLVSLQACAEDGATIGTRQQAEIIEVHACRPGWIEDGERCIDPGLIFGPGPGNIGGGGREHPDDGGGGGGGPAPAGTPVMGEPGVTIFQWLLGTWICKSVCASMSYAICRGVELACAVGSTFTLGGLVLPCVGIIPTACLTGIAGGVACSELFCEDRR